jgi:channel protein (hemolysin III family)
MMFAEIISLPGINEPFSAISHYLGAFLFAILGGILIRRGRGDRLRVVALTIYVATLLCLFIMSGTFHLVRRGTPEWELAGRLDYSAIYLLIAGSFTPPHALLFRGFQRWFTLALIWTLAIVGITLKWLYFDGFTHGISVIFYIAMGWIGAIGGIVAWRRYGWQFVKPLFGGALAYTIGAFFEVLGPDIATSLNELTGITIRFWPGVVESHELWHVAVLIGAALHWAFIYQFADGSVPPLIDRASRDRAKKAA